MPDVIDCVVVGYYEAPLEESLHAAATMKEVSGGYRHLLANTLSFNGKRVRYPELINRCRQAVTGQPSDLHVGRLPNLGACYLVSFLRRRSLRAELVNFVNHDRQQLLDLLSESPRAVAITTTFYFEPRPIQHLVGLIRENSPETRIIVGGPHIYHLCSDYPPAVQDQLLLALGADIYVFDSQGELTLSRVCAELRRPQPDLSAIPNLVWRQGSKAFHRTPLVPEDNPMDENAVDWSCFDQQLLLPAVQTRTARSCAYKCAFCRYPVIAGALNLSSLAAVEDELDCLHSIGVTHLLFIDDTFNIPRGRFKDVCRLMIRKRYGFRWFSYFRCANADAESFDLAAESGCTGVFLGIESGDQSILKAMNKGATIEKYRQGLARLHQAGIISYASFIVGFPGETEQTARNTLRFIDEIRPSYYCLEAYYHDKKVPVGQRSQQLGISGQGYSWHHPGMNWQRASDLVEEGYRTICGSTILPLYSFDLWSLAYLMGQGFALQDLDAFLRTAARLLVEGLDGRQVDSTPYEEPLLRAWQRSPSLPE